MQYSQGQQEVRLIRSFAVQHFMEIFVQSQHSIWEQGLETEPLLDFLLHCPRGLYISANVSNDRRLNLHTQSLSSRHPPYTLNNTAKILSSCSSVTWSVTVRQIAYSSLHASGCFRALLVSIELAALPRCISSALQNPFSWSVHLQKNKNKKMSHCWAFCQHLLTRSRVK